jgi:hypothetical protein
MVIVRTGGGSSAFMTPDGARRTRPAWASARERGPFFHQKDREGLQQPALHSGTNGEQIRPIVLLSHNGGVKDGKEIKPQHGKKTKPQNGKKKSKPPRAPNQRVSFDESHIQGVHGSAFVNTTRNQH